MTEQMHRVGSGPMHGVKYDGPLEGFYSMHTSSTAPWDCRTAAPNRPGTTPGLIGKYGVSGYVFNYKRFFPKQCGHTKGFLR